MVLIRTIISSRYLCKLVTTLAPKQCENIGIPYVDRLEVHPNFSQNLQQEKSWEA